MSHTTRRTLLTGAATSLALPLLSGIGLAQTADGYDDSRLYKDQDGNLYRKRGGEYVRYYGRVQNGRPVPGSEPAPGTSPDPDAEAYARRQAEQAGAPPPGRPARKPDGYTVAAQPPDDGPPDYVRAYGPVSGEPFPVQPVNWKKFNPAFLRQEVAYTGGQPPGTVVVDPKGHFLYFILPGGRARRYGVGVGKQGFSWSGTASINSKQAWPDWYPPPEMIERRPDLRAEVSKLQSGVGVPGGTRNPLGARAMYLWQNNKDTLFRIHGTTEPQSIGKSVSSGCIRMINQDAIDLFNRVEVGTKVVVLS